MSTSISETGARASKGLPFRCISSSTELALPAVWPSLRRVVAWPGCPVGAALSRRGSSPGDSCPASWPGLADPPAACTCTQRSMSTSITRRRYPDEALASSSGSPSESNVARTASRPTVPSAPWAPSAPSALLASNSSSMISTLRYAQPMAAYRSPTATEATGLSDRSYTTRPSSGTSQPTSSLPAARSATGQRCSLPPGSRKISSAPAAARIGAAS